MAEQVPKWEDMPIHAKIEAIQYVAFFPALTVMVFIRRKIGFRMVRPNWLVCMALIAAIVPNILSSDHRAAPIIFAILVFAMGLYHRRARWLGLGRGERWHTASTGISWLESVPLPKIFCNEYRIYRFLDPIACFIVGLVVIALGLRSLGFWIVFASMALIIWEQGVYDRLLNRMLDIHDGLIDAEVQQQIATHYRQPAAGALPMEDTAGLPTGLAQDIEKQVELRKAKRATVQDNPAPDKPPVRQYVQVNVVAASGKPVPRPAQPDNMVKDAPDDPANPQT